MGNTVPNEDLDWLNQNPGLDDLVGRYPGIWEEVGRELITTAKTGRTQKLNELAEKARLSAELWKNRIRKSGNNPKVIHSAVQQVAKSRMFLLALDKCCLAAASGKVSGKVRFNLLNGYIVQKLLFSRDLVRKPASLRWFKFWWRFVWQKKLLIPLVQGKGIYCFYSKELITALTAMIAGRLCLEIGAGDGTLARFLKAQGADIIATDDLSWVHTIKYPENVENSDAKTALAKYKPPVVICSWPPPGNSFERQVFLTESVQLYIVIGSGFKFISGNWEAYAQQQGFDWEIDEGLSRLVIPPEGNNAVVVFRRKVE
jgi:hypothetical protein